MVEGAGKRAVILGAGVAGLATALRLAEGGGWRPRLLEREDRPGGLARSLHFRGVSTDLGPHRIHTEIPEVQALIESVAARSLVRLRRSSHIFLGKKWLTYPPRPLELLGALGPIRMARFGTGFALEKLRPRPAQETYESLMRAAFGGPLWEFLLRPYSAKTWKIDPGELHADTARVRVSAGSLGKLVAGLLRREQQGAETALREFRYVKGGAETLVRHLWAAAHAAGAELELNTAVQELELDERGRVRAALALRRPAHGTAEGADQRFEGELFVSTVPLPILLGRLLPQRAELMAAREAAARLEYLDMAFVCLIVRRKVITGDNWLYFPEPHLIFNRGYEAKSFDPAMAPEDKSVICLEITMRRGDALARESDALILQTATEHIVSTGLFRKEEIEEGLVYRIPYAYPLYKLDYDVQLGKVLAGLRGLGNLVTLGRQGLFNHNNMDHSIWMGLQAADKLNSYETAEAVAAWYDRADDFKRMRIVD
ncbi:MAG TPA: FAD-dependent oxidoreductase [Candidatus Sumerlaeota bacterium]|nr:FAD-dependent oxidoreductase [Candidatus Sumerlaeota bacterium]